MNGGNAKMVLSKRQELREDFRKQLVILVTGAFAFTAALFWNNAIKNTISRFIPTADTWYWEIFIAVLVTAVAVVATYLVTRLTMSPREGKK